MAFHVDRGSARLRAQRGLAGPGGDHLLDAGQTAPDHAPAPQRDAGDQFLVQRETGQPAGIAGQDLGRHHDVAGFQRGIEPAGDAEADDAPDRRRDRTPSSSARNCCGSLLLQMTVMPGPAAMRASCTRPVTINTGRGSIELPADCVSPRPQIHIPTPTTLLLVLLKFRYRANAQSGKNFE